MYKNELLNLVVSELSSPEGPLFNEAVAVSVWKDLEPEKYDTFVERVMEHLTSTKLDVAFINDYYNWFPELEDAIIACDPAEAHELDFEKLAEMLFNQAMHKVQHGHQVLHGLFHFIRKTDQSENLITELYNQFAKTVGDVANLNDGEYLTLGHHPVLEEHLEAFEDNMEDLVMFVDDKLSEQFVVASAQSNENFVNVPLAFLRYEGISEDSLCEFVTSAEELVDLYKLGVTNFNMTNKKKSWLVAMIQETLISMEPELIFDTPVHTNIDEN